MSKIQKKYALSATFRLLKINLLIFYFLSSTFSIALTSDLYPESDVIHYLFIIDNNIPNLIYEKQLIEELIAKINRTIPNVIVSPTGLTTSDLVNLDRFANTHFNFKKSLSDMDHKYCSLKTLKNASEMDHMICEQYQKLSPVLANIIKSNRTVIIIDAHGGHYPYNVGYFSPESSHLVTRRNVEFVILSCSTGNIQLSKKIKSPMTGASRADTVNSGLLTRALLEYLNIESVKVPRSAFDFYEHLKKIQNQLLQLTLFSLLIQSEYIEGELTPREYLSYYIDSCLAKIIGRFNDLDLIPASNLGPWYADEIDEVYAGSKNTPWYLISNAESIESVISNVLMITTVATFKTIAPLAIVIYYTYRDFLQEAM